MDESSGPQAGDALPNPIPRDPPPPPGYVDPLEGNAALDDLLPDAPVDDAGAPPAAGQRRRRSA